MSEALHCDCDVEDIHSHENNCLVGAIDSVAFALKLLGNADAATPMGAIEAFGGVIEEGISKIILAIETKE